MKYEVLIVPSAEKDLDKLPASVRSRISSRIFSLEDSPRPRGAKKLSRREEYRLQVGEYRVLYTVNHKTGTVTILAVCHRREV